jgi:hypothetical protein
VKAKHAVECGHMFYIFLLKYKHSSRFSVFQKMEAAFRGKAYSATICVFNNSINKNSYNSDLNMGSKLVGKKRR